jgi:hypothetical protein
MGTLDQAACGAALCGALLVPAAAQEAADVALHDGIWQVATEPVSGPCSKRFEFKLSVDDGRISYAGIWPVDASGSVNALGVIEILVVRGEETVAAKGVVRGDTASGKWVSPVKNCMGSWVARKA